MKNQHLRNRITSQPSQYLFLSYGKNVRPIKKKNMYLLQYFLQMILILFSLGVSGPDQSECINLVKRNRKRKKKIEAFLYFLGFPLKSAHATSPCNKSIAGTSPLLAIFLM